MKFKKKNPLRSFIKKNCTLPIIVMFAFMFFSHFSFSKETSNSKTKTTKNFQDIIEAANNEIRKGSTENALKILIDYRKKKF